MELDTIPRVEYSSSSDCCAGAGNEFRKEAEPMSWKSQFKADPLPWLLENESPGVRYLAMRDILKLPSDGAELRAARKKAHKEGPIAAVLSKMDASGYWVKPGPGYTPKYRSTVWAIILLAQLGASIEEDKRISIACAYLASHALIAGGQFTLTGAPSGTADCLQGNLCWALLKLGYDASFLRKAIEWMGRSVTGEGIAPMTDRAASVRYYAGKCGPTFACGANNKLPCAWGGVKVMMAFGELPKSMRIPVVTRAVKRGSDFLLSVDPASARYPAGYSAKPNSSWWKFGFPVFYITDLLQIVEALIAVGFGRDPRLAGALALIRSKQDDAARWPLEYDYTGKTWADFGPKKAPNKWVTLRAVRTLRNIPA
jgi:hypothetical protein